MRRKEYVNILLAHQTDWEIRADLYIKVLVERETTLNAEYFERLAEWCKKPYETDEEEFAYRHYLFLRMDDIVGGSEDMVATPLLNIKKSITE